MMKFYILGLLLILATNQDLKAINQNIAPPKYIKNRIGLVQQIHESLKVISVDFPDINFEISYEVYAKNQSLSQQLYQKSSYKDNSVLNNCDFYPSVLNRQLSSQINQLQGEPISYYNSQSSMKLYMVLDNNVLCWHKYDNKQIKMQKKIDIPNNIVDLKNGIQSSYFSMLQLNNKLYLFVDGMAYILDQNSKNNDYLKPVTGVKNDSTHCSGIYEIDQNALWISGRNSIYIYKVQQQNNFIIYQQLDNFTNQDISAVVMQKSQSNHIFYVTTINKLHVIDIDSDKNIHHQQFLINGTCTKITKIKDTLYLGCTLNKVNFITQLQIQKRFQRQGTIQYEINLNRFYDDRMVQGVHRVQPLGYDKILLIGQQQSLIIGQAINRNVLINLANKQKKQKSTVTYSFGILDILNIKSYANSASSTVIMIKRTSVQLVKINQEPPQLWCNFNRSQVGPVVSALIVFNTTHCPYSRNDPTTTGGTNTVCQSFYGYKFDIGAMEYEKTTADITIFGIVLLLLILTLVCVGWCFKFRRNINETRQKIIKKINELKNKNKQLKQI